MKTISFQLDSVEQASAVLAALKPELNGAHEKRCQTGISVKNACLEVRFNALDVKALESSKKHYVEMIRFCEKIWKEV